MPVNVLTEPAEVDRLAPDLRSLCVDVACLRGVVSEREAMDHAGLPGAVGSEQQRDRAQRNALGLAEGLKIPNAESIQ